MSDQELIELRLFIAEACGWEIELQRGVWPNRYLQASPDGSVYEGSLMIPKYPWDLNAMAQAEQTLSHQERRVYALRLQDAHGDLAAIFATALQRAQAFRAVKASTAKTP